MNRPQLSSATPKPSARDLARFRVLVEPANRRRSAWSEARTLGDILDTAPMPCLIRNRWYSADREEFGVIFKPCGKRTCPACVIDWLSQRIAPAWASWTSRVLVERFDGSRAWEWVRQSRGIRMRGDDAAVGVLVLPNGADDGRLAFIPDPDGLRGSELDAAFVVAVRAIPVPTEAPEVARVRSDAFGYIPGRISNETAASLAEDVGGQFKVRGGRQWRGWMTAEQNSLWVELMRSA